MNVLPHLLKHRAGESQAGFCGLKLKSKLLFICQQRGYQDEQLVETFNVNSIKESK